MGAGYGFIDDAEGRRVMMRVAFSEDMAKWVDTLPHIQADRRSALAYGRHRQPEQFDAVKHHRKVRAELAALDAALETGAPLPGEDVDEPAAPTAPVSVGGVSVPAPLGGKVIPMPSRPAAQPAPASAQQAKVSSRAEQVLAALRSETKVWTSAELVEATGLSASVVSKALGELVQAGHAYRPDGVQGKHAVTSAGTAYVLPAVPTKETAVPTTHRPVDPADVPAEAREFWTGWDTCPGCSAEPGANHDDDCDHAMCPECGFQRIQCDEHADSTRPARWHGVHAWAEIADQMGWWVEFGHFGAAPDSERVQIAVARGELAWVPEAQRYARATGIAIGSR
jgi:hypothetical protein